MPSPFAGTWQYVKHSVKGSANIIKDLTTVTIEENTSGVLSAFKFKDPSNNDLIFELAGKANDNDVSVKKMNGTIQTHRGRLVILSTDVPPLMAGTIASGTYGPVGDDNVEVFVAVKTS